MPKVIPFNERFELWVGEVRMKSSKSYPYLKEWATNKGLKEYVVFQIKRSGMREKKKTEIPFATLMKAKKMRDDGMKWFDIEKKLGWSKSAMLPQIQKKIAADFGRAVRKMNEAQILEAARLRESGIPWREVMPTVGFHRNIILSNIKKLKRENV